MDIEENERPVSTGTVPPTGAERPAIDANDNPLPPKGPECDDALADIASDASFPASDPSSAARPGMTNEPVPSSGFSDDQPEDDRV